MKVDIFLDTGVSIDIPDGTDIDSDEGLKIVKEAAIPRLVKLLREESFELLVETEGAGEPEEGDYDYEPDNDHYPVDNPPDRHLRGLP